MKQLPFYFLIALSGLAFAQEVSNSYDLRVAVTRVGDRFQVNASYEVPITVCDAFAFITDYDGAKNLPGIVDSKVLSRSGNKVKVARLLEERILFIPFEMRSELEYLEVPNKAVFFEQLSGDTKYYKGSWRLSPEKDFTTFKYDAQVEPNSLVPSAVIEFFIKNIVRRQFESMAEMASLKRSASVKACK
ncbi:MAG: SRPBCC family protein [Pseudomonadota bacterium]|jgi:hypothetical protein